MDLEAGHAASLRDGRAAPGASVAGDSPSMAGGLAAADRDPARLALLGLRDADLEDAVVEARGHGLGVDALGQRQRAGEGAERALDAVEALSRSSCSALRSPETVSVSSSTSI